MPSMVPHWSLCRVGVDPAWSLCACHRNGQCGQGAVPFSARDVYFDGHLAAGPPCNLTAQVGSGLCQIGCTRSTSALTA